MTPLTLGDASSFAVNTFLLIIQSRVQEIANRPLLQMVLRLFVETIELLVKSLCGLAHKRLYVRNFSFAPRFGKVLLNRNPELSRLRRPNLGESILR